MSVPASTAGELEVGSDPFGIRAWSWGRSLAAIL